MPKKHWTQTPKGKAKLKAIAAKRRGDDLPGTKTASQVAGQRADEFRLAEEARRAEEFRWTNREKQPRFIELRGHNFGMTIQFD